MKRDICEECGGKIEKKVIPYIFLGENLGKFPAEVCGKCREILFDGNVVEKIEAISKKKGLWGLASKTKISKMGNSMAVSINKKIANFTKLKKGEEVQIYPEDRHRLIIEIPG